MSSGLEIAAVASVVGLMILSIALRIFLFHRGYRICASLQKDA